MRTILQIGFETFLVPNSEETRNALVKALEYLKKIELNFTERSYCTVPADYSIEVMSDEQFEKRFNFFVGKDKNVLKTVASRGSIIVSYPITIVDSNSREGDA